MAAIFDFWRQSWIDNVYFLTQYSTYANDCLYQFWCFYHKVNDDAPIDWNKTHKLFERNISVLTSFNLYTTSVTQMKIETAVYDRISVSYV